MKALRNPAERLLRMADDSDAGHAPDVEELDLTIRQLMVLRDDVAEGLHE